MNDQLNPQDLCTQGHGKRRRKRRRSYESRVYQELVEKVDAFFRRVAGRYAEEMKCAPGCDDCCRRSLTFYPFEVERMLTAVEGLGRAELEGVIHRARQAGLSGVGIPVLDIAGTIVIGFKRNQIDRLLEKLYRRP